jgi:predicted extracellular nuclease
MIEINRKYFNQPTVREVMKKSIFVTMALLVVCLWALPALADNQIVQNGGFETWTNGPTNPPDHWQFGTTRVTVSQEASLIRSGSYSMRVDWDSTGTRRVQTDTIPVIAGRTYTCSLWVHDTDTSGRVRPWFFFIPTGSGGPTGYSIDTAGWKVYVYAMAAPIGATGMQLQLRLYSNPSTNAAPKVAYFDDVVLWESVPTANQPPQIGTLYRFPYPLVPGMAQVDVRAAITDDTLVVKDSLYYRLYPGSFTAVGRDSLIGTNYWYHIPGYPVADSIEYFVAAQDGSTPPLRSVSPTAGYTVVDTVMPITSIASAQFNNTNPGGTAPDTCYPSPKMGQFVKLSGKVTGVYQQAGRHNWFWLQDADTAWSGVYVYGGSTGDTVQIGDSITVSCQVAEYYGLTEMASPTGMVKHASGRPLPTPLQITSAQLGSTGCNANSEKYEGNFMELHNFTITSYQGAPLYSYWGNDGSGDSCALWTTIHLSGYDIPTYTIGQLYSSIKGVGYYTRGQYVLGPRMASDLVPAATPPNITNTAVYPSPMRPGLQVTAKATITTTGTIAFDSLYYKLNAGAFTAATHDSNGTGNPNLYWYKMDPSYNIGDSVTYHFVAIDNIAQRTETANAFFKVPDTAFCGYDSIYNVQFSLDQGADSACFTSPKAGQTVNICGIVTAVRQGLYKDIFMQDARTPGGGTSWTGMTIYDFVVGATDTIRAQLGDKLEVTGVVKEYYGLTEIDTVVSYSIRSTGNIVPTPTHVHVVDLRGTCNFGSEAYENILVRMDSVLVLSAKGTSGWWIKDNSSPDSIYMLNGLWSGGTDQPNPLPSTGARYLTLTGVVKYEGRPTYTQGYYLNPRKASDYVPLTIPQANVLYSFPVNQTQLAVQFDRAMNQASAQTPSHYTTVKGLSISSAVLDTTRRRVFLTTATQTNGLADTLIVVGVTDSIGTLMTNPDTAKIWQGFTPINKTQIPKSPTNDTTAMVNEIVTVKGVIVADSSAFYYNNLYINDVSDTVNNGIQLYLPPAQAWLNGYWPQLGDTIVATGMPYEYSGETELNYVTTYKNIYLVNPGPAPAPYYKSTNAADFRYSNDANLWEKHEGVLSKLCDSLVAVAWGLPDTFSQKLVSLSTGDTIAIEAQPVHMNYARLTAGARVDGLLGVVRYRRGFWRLAPRGPLDFNTGLDCGSAPPACDYMVGDVNGNGNVIGSDVTYAVRYFKGLGTPPPDSCYNIAVPTLSHWLYVGGDVNASCTFAGSDVTRLVSFFKGVSALQNCPLFPPPAIRESIIPAKTTDRQE